VTTYLPHSQLLQSVSQYEVDFVIPRVGVDIPLGIDPFLLFKSRDTELASLHAQVINAFNHGISLLRSGNIDVARSLYNFPEVAEIGLGYTRKSKHGSGVGEYLSELIIETLANSPALLERGIHHIEEMQLVSVGIGPDRVSDIAANLIKGFLIQYTQKQCRLWGIPITQGVPIPHVYDTSIDSWCDGYYDLPISPLDGTPILLVPRRIVRALPWINYDDFFRMEFTAYLRSKQVRTRLESKSKNPPQSATLSKEQVIRITRDEIDRVNRYVAIKEKTASEAQPSLIYLDINGTCPETDALTTKLKQIKPGNADAAQYQRVILEILNFLFSPELIDGELEVRTIDGTERRDIIFTNDSDQTFWSYLRSEHSSIVIMFETKNTEVLDNTHLNQTATYMGDRIGYFSVIVTKKPPDQSQQKKIFSIYNDSHPRKVILVFSDNDIVQMLTMKCQGSDPIRYVQKQYRLFRTSVQ
jgi:hypothetical protein